MSSEEMTKQGQGKMLDTYGNEFEAPDFTIKQLRDAIPAHCFVRSPAWGLFYVGRDLLMLATIFTLFHNFLTPEYVPNYYLRFALWGVYTFMQGAVGTGLWVMAHECGHQSFSPSKTLNDTVGFFCHSALLVPYFSWKISHGKHHKATGHMERDQVFVPSTRERYAAKLEHFVHELAELGEETPIVTFLTLLGQQLVGWPLYLMNNTSGHNVHEKQIEGKGKGKRNGWGGGVNHFQPSSPVYEKKDEHLVVWSDFGLATMGAILFVLGQTYGWKNMLVWYWIPYLWVNHWLGKRLSPPAHLFDLIISTVAITYLQHTDPTLPHYKPEAWSFTRGAAATIDRHIPFLSDTVMHGITDTHVLHHYISTIPFYHGEEATAAIKPVMGKHYRESKTKGFFDFFRSMWHSSRWCQWVEESAGAEGNGVLFFRNRNGLGVPPMKMAVKTQ